ncbi:MAG TPA: four helix bundle protein [Cyclobacteriaceae bacterium]|nr:four helix bundle protein [Cyclobacteriaceae bacterium]
MSIEKLKQRFKQFAIQVAILIKETKSNTINNAYCNQLIRSSSSSAANYYAACRGKSKADFINKLKIVEEELDETIFFLDLLQYFNEDKSIEIDRLKNEGNELLAIIVKSIVTTRNNLNK